MPGHKQKRPLKYEKRCRNQAVHQTFLMPIATEALMGLQHQKNFQEFTKMILTLPIAT